MMTPHPALARRGQVRELCQLVQDYAGKFSAGGAIVEDKIDGIRALWINGELVTREGAPIEGVEHIADVLRRIEHAACVPMFFDGELLVAGDFDATLRHLQARGRNGLAGTLHLFDAMPMRVWRGEDSGYALEVRRGRLDELAGPFMCDAVQVLPWSYVETAAETEALGADAIAAGKEGVVVKSATATYRRTRSNAWQRIKRSVTIDARVIGYVEHVRTGMLGALVCALPNGKVTVTQGFSDAERKRLWDSRERLIGGIVEVEGMEKTTRGSLRQPRFVRMRKDRA